LNFEKILTERECCELLKNDTSHWVYHNDEKVVLNISNTFDVYFNFTHMSKAWKIGNMKKDDPTELIRKITEEDTWALNMARTVEMKELVERYGNAQSDRAFFLGDYKSYLLNCYLEEYNC